MHISEHIFIVLQYVFVLKLLVNVRIIFKYIYTRLLFWLQINLPTIYMSAEAISVSIGRVYVDRLSVGVDGVYVTHEVSA